MKWPYRTCLRHGDRWDVRVYRDGEEVTVRVWNGKRVAKLPRLWANTLFRALPDDGTPYVGELDLRLRCDRRGRPIPWDKRGQRR